MTTVGEGKAGEFKAGEATAAEDDGTVALSATGTASGTGSASLSQVAALSASGVASGVGSASIQAVSVQIAWQETADWDAAQSEEAVHHEQPGNQGWAASDVIEQGYPTAFPSFGVNLVAYYPCGESSGSTAFEVAGGATDGAYTGDSLAAEQGPFGFNTPSFETGEYIDTGTQFAPSTGEVAVCAWFKGADSQGDIFDSFSGGGWGLWWDSGNLSIYSDGGTATTTDTVADDNWHLIYGHMDSSEHAVGVDDAVLTTSGDAVGNLENGSGTHHITTNGQAADNRSVVCEMCHVMVFDGALTTAERSILYEAPL